MKNSIYGLICTLLFLCVPSHTSWAKNREKVKITPVSRYDVLIGAKSKIKAKGLMTMHLIEGKVYVEFPRQMLGKELLLSTSIEQISDNGEGAVGQFGDNDLVIRFAKADTVLQVKLHLNSQPIEGSDDQSLENSYAGSLFKSFPIECTTPDSTAYVVNMTPLFLEHSLYTSPFPQQAANTLGGMAERKHRMIDKRSFVKAIKSHPNNIAVQCQQGYDVDHLVFGFIPIRKDYPVSVTANKMLTLLPESKMRPRIADSRVGVQVVAAHDFSQPNTGVKRTYYAKRWRIEPADQAKYNAGEITEPRQPIIFYMDNRMPESWKTPIKNGAEQWNRAFEKIGFKRVVRVVDYPQDDPLFDPNNANYSTIRYAPTGMSAIHSHLRSDPHSGEILQASICLNNGLLSSLYTDRVVCTMAADPKARCSSLCDEMMGEMLEAAVAHEVGRCLGLAVNYAASSMYAVDSLRSASFTQTHGLSPSVMDKMICNFIAQPEDVAKGVRLTQTGIGEADFFAIRWLYQPIAKTAFPRDEYTVLDHWIRAYPQYRFGKAQNYMARYDPTSRSFDLGDDQVLAMKYMVANMKIAVPNFMIWLKTGDSDLVIRNHVYQSMDNMIRMQMSGVMDYIGGIRIRESHQGDEHPTWEIVPREKQREAFLYLADIMRDFSWIDTPEVHKQLEITNIKGVDIQGRFVSDILNRVPYLALCAEKSSAAYTPEEFLDDFYNYVWEGTIKGRSLAEIEMRLQCSLIGSLVSTSEVGKSTIQSEKNNQYTEYANNPQVLKVLLANERRSGFEPQSSLIIRQKSMADFCYSMLLKSRDLVTRKMVASTGATRKHYDYILFKINQALRP